jgi:peptide chain release factor subunit 3
MAEGEKKLSLKERMALKGKLKAIEEFIPTPEIQAQVQAQSSNQGPKETLISTTYQQHQQSFPDLGLGMFGITGNEPHVPMNQILYTFILSKVSDPQQGKVYVAALERFYPVVFKTFMQFHQQFANEMHAQAGQRDMRDPREQHRGPNQPYGYHQQQYQVHQPNQHGQVYQTHTVSQPHPSHQGHMPQHPHYAGHGHPQQSNYYQGNYQQEHRVYPPQGGHPAHHSQGAHFNQGYGAHEGQRGFPPGRGGPHHQGGHYGQGYYHENPHRQHYNQGYQNYDEDGDEVQNNDDEDYREQEMPVKRQIPTNPPQPKEKVQGPIKSDTPLAQAAKKEAQNQKEVPPQKDAKENKKGEKPEKQEPKKPTPPPVKKEAPAPVIKKNVEEIVDLEKIKAKEANSNKMQDLTKNTMNIIFIGHVDSGKSTICGTILQLSGKVDKEEFRRYEMEAKEKNRLNWVQAYIMDINEEERDKGITVEIGKATFDLPKTRFTIIDSPGHKNYVPNMIAGASQADVAALVVSSKSGEFEAGFDKVGQTREHAILASYLGSSHLVVIINKMDDSNWDIKRFNHIKDSMTPFLKNICEYDVDKQVTWVPISAMNRLNMNEKVPESICPWYKGQSLFETLDNIPKKERVYRGCLRMPIADTYDDKGELTLYGKIESGNIKENMKVMLMPNKKEITIGKISDAEDKPLAVAVTGDNIKITVKGCTSEEVRRGGVICGLQYLCHTCFEFEAELTVMDPPANKVVSNGFQAILHLHAMVEEIEITSVKSNKNTNKTGGLICLKQGDTGKVIIKKRLIPPQTEKDMIPMCLEKFSEFPELARLTLRAESSTIAVGKVLRIKSLNRGPGLEFTDYYLHTKMLAEKEAQAKSVTAASVTTENK